jgi:membrane dipeptidase
MLRLAVGCGSFTLFAGPTVARSPEPESPEAAAHPVSRYSPRAQALIKSSHVVDMLCGVRQRLVVKGEENSVAKAGERYISWFKDPSSITRAELQRYFDSGIDTFHIATDIGALLPAPTPFDRAQYLFTGWQKILAAHPKTFLPVYGPRDLDRSRKSGKIAVILGIQNGDHFRTPDDVALFYGLGQRISQLTYNQENHLAGGAFTQVGLKPAGRDVVLAMNRVGMVVDLSHASDDTARGVIDASRVTPIISHTNCRSLNPGFSRDAPDDVIKGVAARGGVIGLTVMRQFVSANEPTTIDDYIRHIDRVVEIAGIEHVGVGGDSDLLPFDGIDDEARNRFFAQASQQAYKWRDKLDIEGLDHPRRMYDIAEQLIKRGYKDADIRLVLGGNWVRVLKRIWTTRA